MTTHDFITWRRRHLWTVEQAAAALEVTPGDVLNVEEFDFCPKKYLCKCFLYDKARFGKSPLIEALRAYVAEIDAMKKPRGRPRGAKNKRSVAV